MAKGHKRKANDPKGDSASSGREKLPQASNSKRGKSDKNPVATRTGKLMVDTMSMNVNKTNKERKSDETSSSKLRKTNLINPSEGSTNNNATCGVNRTVNSTIQTRGIGRVDLVKLGIIKEANNGKTKVKSKSNDKRSKVLNKSPNVIVGAEGEEAVVTDGVLLSVHAEGSIDDDDSELELDYDEEIGLIETDV